MDIQTLKERFWVSAIPPAGQDNPMKDEVCDAFFESYGAETLQLYCDAVALRNSGRVYETIDTLRAATKVENFDKAFSSALENALIRPFIDGSEEKHYRASAYPELSGYFHRMKENHPNAYFFRCCHFLVCRYRYCNVAHCCIAWYYW